MFRMYRLVFLTRPLLCLMVSTCLIVVSVMWRSLLFCLGTLWYLTPPPLYYKRLIYYCPGSAVKSPVSYLYDSIAIDLLCSPIRAASG
jgi:hypothetical protein